MTLAALIDDMVSRGLMLNGLGEYERLDAPGWYASVFRRNGGSTARYWQGFGKSPEMALRAALDAFEAPKRPAATQRPAKAWEDLL